jgi:hypothetical protein
MGACTVKSSLRLELKTLLKRGLLKEGQVLLSDYSWTSGANIKVLGSWKGNDKHFRLVYNHTDNEGNKITYDYNVQLETVKSNLGKGEVLYFVCPVSGKRCRTLFSAYNSALFKAKAAFKNRIYYNCQRQSKYNYWLTRYWDLKKELEELENKPYRESYNNKPTRTHLRIEQLRKRLAKYNMKMDNIFEWRCYNWRTNFFALPDSYQQSIINSKDCLYMKYHLEGRTPVM